MQAPPTSLIFFSASLEKNLALTTTGWLGSWPLPSTLLMLCLQQSITGAWVLSLEADSRT